jgi:glycosyltransferase involved in cell wall biosynthesis
MVVGEALSCGVPVVTTAVGPWGESGEVLKCESAKVLKLREKRSSSRQYQLTVGEGENIEHSTSNIEHPTGDGEVLKLEEKLETANCQLPTGNLDRGLIVVETSVEGVSEGLRQMMALSDAERKELGQRGCEWVKREFSWESVAQEMLRAYKLK